MGNQNISDLTTILFEELEAIRDRSIPREEIGIAFKRADKISKFAENMIDLGNLMLKARIAADTTVNGDKILPAILGANFGPENDTPKKQ